MCEKPGEPISVQRASQNFRRVLAKSKWSVLSGWHVFRHSFASNCARKGLDQRVIDEFMGHTTEEMRRRYRHLFPEHKKQALALVFGQHRTLTDRWWAALSFLTCKASRSLAWNHGTIGRNWGCSQVLWW